VAIIVKESASVTIDQSAMAQAQGPLPLGES
jgi:hypothetical protein